MRIRPAAAVLAVALVVLSGAGWTLARADDDVREPAAAGSLAALRSPPSASSSPAPGLGTGPVTARPAGAARFAPPPPPVRVAIPALGVDAPVVPVGVTADRTLEVPDSPSTVGWYRHGPPPGAAAGSSVLASHVDSAAEGPGVFFRLTELVPGAEVVVVRADGSTVSYEVIALRQFPKDELERHDLFTAGGPHRLTLLTCGGDFDPGRRTYLDNVVVVAVPAPRGPAS